MTNGLSACSANLMSHSWFTVSKNDRMSASSIQFTFVLLSAIYEEDFLGFSYGFRPGRSTHDAMDALVVGITTAAVALWTILSSRAATAIGRCRPSGLGM